MDEECPQNTNIKPWKYQTYYFRWVAPPGGDFRFQSVVTPSKSINNSPTVKDEPRMSTEHYRQTMVGLSNGHTTSVCDEIHKHSFQRQSQFTSY
jgi:5-deoxy-D-glucuronate isomerase